MDRQRLKCAVKERKGQAEFTVCCEGDARTGRLHNVLQRRGMDRQSLQCAGEGEERTGRLHNVLRKRYGQNVCAQANAVIYLFNDPCK